MAKTIEVYKIETIRHSDHSLNAVQLMNLDEKINETISAVSVGNSELINLNIITNKINESFHTVVYATIRKGD